MYSKEFYIKKGILPEKLREVFKPNIIHVSNGGKGELIFVTLQCYTVDIMDDKFISFVNKSYNLGMYFIASETFPRMAIIPIIKLIGNIFIRLDYRNFYFSNEKL